MLKFGELYLNNGKWQKQWIFSRKWVKNSVNNYRPLENTADKNGYLWGHHTYQLNGKIISSIEALGAGGQYIFILPNLKTVVVITSGNYRNGKTKQSEYILEHFILPTLLN
jgi:CubicO group peptidase (beta-lactamase class C family)